MLSYGELLKRMDGLARLLREHEVQPADRVAICLERSFDMIIAILAVMAAGAVYVPLDPVFPQERLVYLLLDCRAACLLSGSDGAELALAAGVPRLDPKDWPAEGTAVETKETESAYIIYTSGSTGFPKGVEVGHAAMENYVQWATSTLPFTGRGVPLFTSIAFDHAVTNIFPPLLMSEPIILLPPLLGGSALAHALLGDRSAPVCYSYVKITPSLFQFLDKGQRARLGCQTKLLMFGGEKLAAGLVEDARSQNPVLAVMNHYGPTEATVGCCFYLVPENLEGPAVPVGLPLPGVETSIRRPDLSISENGEPGELLIAGKALAAGYWGRPDLTKAAFLILPDENQNEKRWYRTGDMARRSEEGTIALLGRTDGQLKIMGSRIEPMEITRHLERYAGVRQAVVFTVERQPAIELVAALAFFGGQLKTEEIRKYLQGLLPAAMIPARYLILDELPLLPGGKTDIKSLRALVPAQDGDLSVEAAIAIKFAEVLGDELTDWDDDYFMAGGDSLGSVDIVVWAEERFNVPLEISCLFDYPTVNSFAAHLRSLTPADETG
jgi:nonribosomal peptide synthetase DhbF